MFRLLTVVMGGLICLATASVAEAQRVRVGPFGGVGVRLPRLGVSVDVLPFWGGTRVRAPFTAVDTGWYRYGYRTAPYGSYYAPRYLAPSSYFEPSYYPDQSYGSPPSYAPGYSASAGYADAPSAPTGAVAPQPYDSQWAPGDAAPSAGARSLSLAEDLRAAAERLQYALAQRQDGGETWLAYLAPGQIIAAIDRGDSPGSLGNLLMNYEGVVNSRLNIRSADGFDQTHQLLRQWVNGGSDARGAADPYDPYIEELPPPVATPVGG